MKPIKINNCIIISFSLIFSFLIASVAMTTDNYSMITKDNLIKTNGQTAIKSVKYPNPASWEDGGFIESTGTYFEISDSKYLNITLTSSETIHIRMESVPSIVSFIIESRSSANSTQLTISGFRPNMVYYRYQDGFLMESFTIDSVGQYTYIQDICQNHHVYIQEQESTIYLDSDFTFTENIYEPLVVIADNIVIDGNGYELQGGSGFGIYLNGRTNVTIKNIKLGKWSYVIFLYLSSNITISGNTMLKLGGDLIKLDSSSNNTICKNIVDESTYIAYFIELWYSSNNNIFENSILPWFGDSPGIILWDSSNNKIYGNNISNINSGIILNDFSNNNSISGNILTNLHSEAISIDYYSSNNNISENIIRNTWAGILIGYFSENNRVFRNTITVITGWVGYSAVVFVYYTSNNFIYENNITSDYTAYGFWLLSASYNNISRNTITNCYIGIYLSDSVENIIYHNNIMNNLDQVSDENPGNNHWYHPDLLEGNYWSDYPGVDDGSGLDKHAIADDGIGDTEIPWPGLDYDYYPLMHPLLLTPTGTNVEVIDPITGVNITFPEVISSGITTVSKSDSGPSPPAGYRVSGVYYEISTTATYIGSMIIGIPYDESQIHGKEENLKLMHYDPVYGWTEITGKVDTVNNIIYGWEPELSIFAIMEPYIEATIDIDPDTLNLKSKGKFITAYIELQEGYDVCNIDISTVMIQESIPAAPSPTDIADYDDDGIPDLMVKFDRTSVQLSLSPGEAVEITIDGSLIDGTYFSGTAYIRVIDKGNEHIDEEDPSSIA